jgi:hypothetical protein
MTCRVARQASPRTANTNEPAMVPKVPAGHTSPSSPPSLPIGDGRQPPPGRHTENKSSNESATAHFFNGLLTSWLAPPSSEAAEMTAYDSMPAPVRRALREALFNVSAVRWLMRCPRQTHYSEARRRLDRLEAGYLADEQSRASA